MKDNPTDPDSPLWTIRGRAALEPETRSFGKVLPERFDRTFAAGQST